MQLYNADLVIKVDTRAVFISELQYLLLEQ